MPATSKSKERKPVLHLADARQATVLLLRVVEERNERRRPKGLKQMTRAQLTAPMLKRLWGRPRLSPEFLRDVAEWLLVAGWVFFDAGRFYALVKVSAVENWPRLSTKAIRAKLDDVKLGTYNFADYEHLLWLEDSAAIDEEDGAPSADSGDTDE